MTITWQLLGVRSFESLFSKKKKRGLIQLDEQHP